LPFPEVALKNGVAEIRAKNPNLGFTNAYNQLMREQRKLFVTGDDVGEPEPAPVGDYQRGAQTHEG
jgi:hypothetical protein